MNKYQEREIRKIIISFLGSNNLGPKAFFIIVCVMMFFAWLPDGLSALLDKIFGSELLKWEAKGLTMLFQIFIPVGIFFLVRWLVLKNILNVDININSEPQKAKVLVLFLSENKKSKEYLEFKKIDEFDGKNYQMPLIAIGYHLEKLEKIAIACSNESFKQKDDFLQCVRNVFDEKTANLVKFSPIGDFENAKCVYDFWKILTPNSAKVA